MSMDYGFAVEFVLEMSLRIRIIDVEPSYNF